MLYARTGSRHGTTSSGSRPRSGDDSDLSDPPGKPGTVLSIFLSGPFVPGAARVSVDVARDIATEWVVISILIFGLRLELLYRILYSHYIAAVTCLFVLVSVAALEQLSRWNFPGWLAGSDAARLIVYLCLAHFVFWYGLHLAAGQAFTQDVIRYETWDAINHDDPDGRIVIAKRLAETTGKQLVFVRYYPPHTFQEWVYNAARYRWKPRCLGSRSGAGGK